MMLGVEIFCREPEGWFGFGGKERRRGATEESSGTMMKTAPCEPYFASSPSTTSEMVEVYGCGVQSLAL